MLHRLREFPAGARHVLFKDRGGPWESNEVVTCKSMASNETKKSGLDFTGNRVLDSSVSFLQAR